MDRVTAWAFNPGIMQRLGREPVGGATPTLKANEGDNRVAVAYPIENHPADSRITVCKQDDPVQTLSSRMGTGGQHTDGADCSE